MYLKCQTCDPPDYFPAPEVNGVPTLSIETSTIVQGSTGPVAVSICPACADAIVAGTTSTTGVAPSPNEIPASAL